MNITLVRGALVSPYDFQLYAPLAERHRLTLIGADWQTAYRHPVHLQSIQHLEAPVWFGRARTLGPEWPFQLNRLVSWTAGQSFGLSHLEKLVGKPDVLESAEVFFTMTYQCLQIKRRQGCALVVTVRENLPHSGETHPLRRWRKRQVMQEADHLIAITPTTRAMLLEDGAAPEKISIVPLSIDMNRFVPAPKDPTLMNQLGIHPEDCVILFAGRLIPEKGIEDLLKAMEEIFKSALSSTKLRFVFIGDGPLRATIHAAQKRFPGRVIHCASVDYAEMPRYHNLADIFVLPSRRAKKVAEQFGFVLVESMACAKTVISTRVGSIPDVIGEAGLLVPPEDWQALSETILRLVNSPIERLTWGQKGLTWVRARFDANMNAKKLEAIYAAAIDRAKSAYARD